MTNANYQTYRDLAIRKIEAIPVAILILIESMKMEIPVITEDGGTVKEILVKENDPVTEGQVVAVLED